ncbi:MAG: DMT family transporter [Candidatus Tectomicrobia bacterium]|nr:DMT family transporter [Candidatus Tectomicrobia bacterium]
MESHAQSPLPCQAEGDNEAQGTTERIFTLTDLMVFVSSILWGMGTVVTKMAFWEILPWNFLFLRNIPSVLLSWGFLRLTEGSLNGSPKPWKEFMKLGFLGQTLPPLFWSFGLSLTTASNAALMSSTAPLFTTMYVAIFEKERIGPKGWLGVVMAFGGIYLILSGQGGEIHLTWSSVKGDLIILFSTLFWSYYTIAVGHSLQRYSNLRVTTFAMAFGALFLIPPSTGQILAQDWGAISIFSWGLALYAALFNTVVPMLLWNAGVSGIGPSRTMLYQYVSPVVTILASILFLGETMTVTKLIGAVVVLGGIYLARVGDRL